MDFWTYTFNPNRSLEPVQILFDCWAYCLPYSWRRSGLRQENKTGKMPTNKRKMNRKRWKKTKITSKRSNDRLGFNTFANKQNTWGCSSNECFRTAPYRKQKYGFKNSCASSVARLAYARWATHCSLAYAHIVHGTTWRCCAHPISTPYKDAWGSLHATLLGNTSMLHRPYSGTKRDCSYL